MQIRILIVVLLSIGLFSCAADREPRIVFDNLRLRDPIKDSLQLIIKDSVLYSSGVGDSEVSDLRNLNWIIKVASSEELNEMGQSDDPIIKAIGLKGLFIKRDKDWFDVFKAVLRDTGEYVTFQDGCFRYDYRLPEYCLVEILRYEYMDGVLTLEQTSQVDKLIKMYKLNVIPKNGSIISLP